MSRKRSLMFLPNPPRPGGILNMSVRCLTPSELGDIATNVSFGEVPKTRFQILNGNTTGLLKENILIFHEF